MTVVKMSKDFEVFVKRIRQLKEDGKLELEVLEKGTVQTAEDSPTLLALIRIGTGTDLQVALFLDGENFDGFYPTQGGQVNFAARSDEEFEILKYIKEKYNLPRVPINLVVSEQGVVDIYNFLYEHPKRSEILQTFKLKQQSVKQRPVENENLRVLEKIGDIDKLLEIDLDIKTSSNPVTDIVEGALSKHDLLCLKTMVMFIEAYGSEVGNFALKILPYGGLYLAGNIDIVSQILAKGSWHRELFRQKLKSKGRMTKLIERIPIYLVKN